MQQLRSRLMLQSSCQACCAPAPHPRTWPRNACSPTPALPPSALLPSLVDLIREHQQTRVLCHHLRQCLQLFPAPRQGRSRAYTITSPLAVQPAGSAICLCMHRAAQLDGCSSNRAPRAQLTVGCTPTLPHPAPPTHSPRVHRARGVGWRAEDEQARGGGQRSAQLGGRQLEALLRGGLHDDGGGPRQAGHLGV